MQGFLTDLYHSTVKNLSNLTFNKSSEVHRTLVSLYATIIELTNSTLLLRQNGAFTGVDILLRSALEAHVDLINLANNDVYLKAMNASYDKEWLKLMKEAATGENEFLASLKNDPELGKQIELHQAALDEFQKTSKIPHIAEKFSSAGMQKEYQSVYNSLCTDSHNNIRALVHRHFRISNGKIDLTIFQEPSKTDLAASLDSFIAILNKSNEIMHDYFNSPDEVKQELDYYKRYREEKGLSWLGDLDA